MELRNVAIIAHVDHGKTTLVDQLLHQSGMFREGELDKLAGGQHGLVLDSNDLERERGITILSKNCAIYYTSAVDNCKYRINIIDTPGHADFGGEVERVLGMADGVLLLVDAFEGPMPQTRFVLQKALGHGLRPIVVVNKADRPDARPHFVVDEVFDLLVQLNASDEALDFPVIYASAREGWAVEDLHDERKDLRPVLECVLRHVPAPHVQPNEPLQLQITTLDYSEFVGRIGIGRVQAGSIRPGMQVTVLSHKRPTTNQKILQVLAFEGLKRGSVEEVVAGDLCAVVGLDPIDIGDTICHPDAPRALPPVSVDEPTVHITVRINDGPLAGRYGRFLTSRQIDERLERELHSNVALRVAPGEAREEFVVSGRGVMHLGILLENMRREGYELTAGKPLPVLKEVDGKKHEPVERLSVECPTDCQRMVMKLVGERRGDLARMETRSGQEDYVHLEFLIPARGLIGLRGRMLSATQGRAIMHHNFYEYQPLKGDIPHRLTGVLVASDTGQVTAYALDALYDRGTFFVRPGDPVYEGQVVGENCKEGDLVVNVVKGKQLTNVRASNKDDAARVRPPRELSLEEALEYIQEDELVEITPENLRMRKRFLTETERRRLSRRK
ncbi:MAG: translational GTPase TypA [Verrucomicrobiota bacterium]|nr:translational GTPase TypA [Verrucomicrobiota bacterium]